MLALVAAAVFLVIFLIVAAAVIVARHWMAAPQDPNTPPALLEPDWLDALDSPGLLKQESLSTITIWDRILAHFDGVKIMRKALDEAGMNWSVGRLTAMMLLAAAATFAMCWQMSFIPVWVTFLGSLGAGLAPYGVILRRRVRRLLRLEEQFPEALDSMARSLRGGNGLAAALEILARDVPQPLAAELRKTVDERNLGMNWDQALANLAGRVPIVEVSVFAGAVQLQSRTGGRLHEVLGKLAETMRESASLEAEIRSISAHGKLTGLILTVLPVLIAGMMLWVNPRQIQILWTDPLGSQLLWGAAACLVAAHFIIRKLVDIRI